MFPVNRKVLISKGYIHTLYFLTLDINNILKSRYMGKLEEKFKIVTPKNIYIQIFNWSSLNILENIDLYPLLRK